jgi:glycosyltransferase involved in cell wall biosynthesis
MAYSLQTLPIVITFNSFSTVIMDSTTPILTFVIPCLNEALCLESVILDCHIGGNAASVAYEVLVADNGSTDGSQQLAASAGAVVISVPERGYGAALQAGIKAARGKYVLMGDADGTYDFRDAPIFLERLESDADIVMGNRFQGTIEPGAMPFLHRWLGNPVLSGMGRLLFGISVGDFHCGLRAFRVDQIRSLGLRCSGMEFASEMVIKASLRDLRMEEVPTKLRRDHPARTPHLRTWRDGWRHLKFMLSFSPKYAFLSFSLFLFILSFYGFLSFAFDWRPFSGTNTLIVSSFSFLAALGLLSDYLTTRIMFADAYGRPIGIGMWLNKRILRSRYGVDFLYQLAALGLITGISIFLAVCLLGADGSASSRSENLAIYIAGLLLSLGLFSYLTAAKIATVRSLSPR